MGFQPSRSGFVVRCLGGSIMNSPVDLKYEAQLRAVEVHDECADGVLPAELESENSTVSQ